MTDSDYGVLLRGECGFIFFFDGLILSGFVKEMGFKDWGFGFLSFSFYLCGRSVEIMPYSLVQINSGS